MSNKPSLTLDRAAVQVVELGGLRYCIVSEDLLARLAERAQATPAWARAGEPNAHELHYDNTERFALRLRARRQQAGWTQAELARKADVRVETINRLEKGRTAPEFGTVRKIVSALTALTGVAAAVTTPGRATEKPRRGVRHRRKARPTAKGAQR